MMQTESTKDDESQADQSGPYGVPVRLTVNLVGAGILYILSGKIWIIYLALLYSLFIAKEGYDEVKPMLKRSLWTIWTRLRCMIIGTTKGWMKKNFREKSKKRPWIEQGWMRRSLKILWILILLRVLVTANQGAIILEESRIYNFKFNSSLPNKSMSYANFKFENKTQDKRMYPMPATLRANQFSVLSDDRDNGQKDSEWRKGDWKKGEKKESKNSPKNREERVETKKMNKSNPLKTSSEPFKDSNRDMLVIKRLTTMLVEMLSNRIELEFVDGANKFLIICNNDEGGRRWATIRFKREGSTNFVTLVSFAILVRGGKNSLDEAYEHVGMERYPINGWNDLNKSLTEVFGTYIGRNPDPKKEDNKLLINPINAMIYRWLWKNVWVVDTFDGRRNIFPQVNTRTEKIRYDDSDDRFYQGVLAYFDIE